MISTIQIKRGKNHRFLTAPIRQYIEIEKPIDETKKNMAANPVRSLVDIDLFHVKKLSKIFSSLGLGTQLGSSFLACFRFFRALGSRAL